MKGQSAIEYLTTYGWAILFLMIVLGAILASGILTPSYFISEECYLGPNLPCDFQLYKQGDDTHIDLDVSNGFPYKIKITKFEITPFDDSGMVVNTADMGTMDISSGDKSKMFATFTGYVTYTNTMKRFNVNIEYVSCAPEVNQNCEPKTELSHIITGRIIGRVLEGDQ